MRKYITTEEAIKNCETKERQFDDFIIPKELLSIWPNNFGINLCSVKGFMVKMKKDGQLKSLRVDFIPDCQQGVNARDLLNLNDNKG